MGEGRAPDDHELQRRLRAGDEEALAILFRRHKDDVHALCCRLTDEHAAEDLLQEAFLRAWRYRRSLAGRARFSTWLYRVTRNVCSDYLRARGRDPVARPVARRLEPEDVAACPDPLSRLHAIQRRDAVRDAVAELPATTREALILSRYHGLTYAEIGEVCELSEGAVKVRIHRALRTLRETLSSREVFREL